ncbi:hypothetical protein MSP7336_01799 [Mycobacterium shimoidei]|uniref:Tail assembly chaperone n=1 Tax=Mycobacterium shimoidei TaxID=29313 RepID=A0A375YXY7_MYCSH|nr:hypothetical protein [Mycobacterium shimoidei]SRX93560.1 hypothetical protein MSP7336_01799 [Mycobacterium shimoidei]
MSEHPVPEIGGPVPQAPSPNKLAQAAEQADEYDSFVKPIRIRTKSGKVFEVPHPTQLDDEQQEAFDELQYEANQCDRWPDVEVPETTTTHPDGSVTVIPKHIERGDFISPYQKGGVRMRPGYNIRLAKIYFGDRYEEFKAAGGRSNDLALALRRAADEMRERQAADSKSAGGGVSVEKVPNTD